MTIFQFLKKMMDECFTGRIILDFHKGSISKKVKKEFVEVIE